MNKPDTSSDEISIPVKFEAFSDAGHPMQVVKDTYLVLTKIHGENVETREEILQLIPMPDSYKGIQHHGKKGRKTNPGKPDNRGKKIRRK